MLKKYLKSKYKPKKVMSDKNKSEIKFLVELDETVFRKLLWSAEV
jgi:outer membrane phospholipase A